MAVIIIVIGGIFAWHYFRISAVEEDKINNLEKQIKTEEIETVNKVELIRENAKRRTFY